MGKKRGQTHDYRVEFFQAHQPPGDRPARRVRGDWSEALLLTRKVARWATTHYAALIYVNPDTSREHELVRYTPDNPPPDNDEDIPHRTRSHLRKDSPR